jgi:predicted O-methyltransferase YrrM
MRRGCDCVTGMALSTLRSAPARDVLDRLHEEAKGDRLRFLALAPRLLLSMARHGSFAKGVTPGMMKECFLPLSREAGEFVHLTARAIAARTVLEFGTSFGISTLYLAAAVRDNGGGVVIGTEIEPDKHARALRSLEQAGLRDLVDVRLGDALETLRELPAEVDMVLLDGWKDLYVPVLDLVRPRLRRGAVVIADNIFTFRKELRPYLGRCSRGSAASTRRRCRSGRAWSTRSTEAERLLAGPSLRATPGTRTGACSPSA